MYKCNVTSSKFVHNMYELLSKQKYDKATKRTATIPEGNDCLIHIHLNKLTSTRIKTGHHLKAAN